MWGKRRRQSPRGVAASTAGRGCRIGSIVGAHGCAAGVTSPRAYESPVAGNLAVPPPAPAHPRRLVRLGPRSLRRGARAGQADLPLRRLLHLLLVPRDGAAIV